MKWGHAVRVRKGTILYAAGVLACGNVLLQVLGFVYRVVLSRFAGAEGLGVYRLVNSVYLVLPAGCLSGVATASSNAANSTWDPTAYLSELKAQGWTITAEICCAVDTLLASANPDVALRDRTGAPYVDESGCRVDL